MDLANTSTPPKRSGGRLDSPASLGRGAGSSPAYLSSIRKHSLYGTDDRVVIDPGSRIWKIGFSGEPKPRKVFYVRDSFPADPVGQEDGVIWDADLVRMADQLDEFRVRNGWGDEMEDVQEAGDVGEYATGVTELGGKVEGETRERREEVLDLVRGRLIKAFRDVYYKHLLTESRSRRVIIITNPFLSDPIKQLIGRVLLDNLQVRSVSFTPAPLLALMAVGRTTGLVLDVGYQESTCVPVFQGRVLNEYITSTRIAGKAFMERLTLLVERFGQPLGDNTQKRKRVGWELAEEIRSRGCFVHPRPVPPISPVGDEKEEDLAEVLFRAYGHTADESTKSTLFEDGQERWLVPGWVRERTAEVFFEMGEEGEEGLQEVVAGCLLKLPIDLRRVMAASLLVTGGGAVLPGFTGRLYSSTVDLINASRPASPPTSTSTSTDTAIPKRLSKERKRGERPYEALAGLVDGLAILNDTSVGSAQTDGEGKQPGTRGSAPAWNGGLMSWIGGSLAGALQISGEEYELDEEQALA